MCVHIHMYIYIYTYINICSQIEMSPWCTPQDLEARRGVAGPPQRLDSVSLAASRAFEGEGVTPVE